ncbi:hypothetical protein RHGRI_014496 [Rhododendron griersonianum]|uniref:Uncharacterized protein n=1 Tax=Rhododendron griersonianum TaxID=479676 RepID=A0AAV6KA60_9ERIC|nr:hypothetical protein RHGRI_014496 [Rhododendron griersonianum]
MHEVLCRVNNEDRPAKFKLCFRGRSYTNFELWHAEDEVLSLLVFIQDSCLFFEYSFKQAWFWVLIQLVCSMCHSKPFVMYNFRSNL